MAKPGRNDRCPCGSGKKYKACCLTKDEAVEHERLAAAQAQRENQAAEKRQSLREVRAAMLAKLAGEFAGDDGSDDDELFADDLCDDDPTDASNAVLALIHDGKLDEAELELEAALAAGAGGPFHRSWVQLRLGNIDDAGFLTSTPEETRFTFVMPLR